MKRIFITGASGFLGRSIFNQLKKEGYLVLGTTTSISSDPEIITLFLEDKEALVSCLKEFQPDIVIHLAAIAFVMHSNQSQIYKTNVIGTEMLLKAIATSSIKKCSVVLASTAGAYGNQAVDYLTEDLPCNPTNHYSYSKMIMEMLSQQFQSEMDITIVRPFNVIGVGQSTSFLIPKLIHQFLNKVQVIQVGNIDSVRDYVDLEVFTQVFSDLIKIESFPKGVLNICSGKGTTGREVLRFLCEISDHQPKLEILPELCRKNEIWRMVGSPEKLENTLGYKLSFRPFPIILEEIYRSTFEKVRAC